MMLFDSGDFMKHAGRAALTLEDDAVVLLGDGAGDRLPPVKSPVAMRSAMSFAPFGGYENGLPR